MSTALAVKPCRLHLCRLLSPLHPPAEPPALSMKGPKDVTHSPQVACTVSVLTWPPAVSRDAGWSAAVDVQAQPWQHSALFQRQLPAASTYGGKCKCSMCVVSENGT